MHALDILVCFLGDYPWSVIQFELALACWAVVLLVLGVVWPSHRVVFRAALLGQGLAGLGLIAASPLSPEFLNNTFFAGLLAQTPLTQVLRLFLWGSGLGVTLLTGAWHERGKPVALAVYPLVIWTHAALMLAVQSQHFLSFFITFEAASVGLYILIGYYQHRRPSLEAALQYLVLSSLSAAFFLLGIALLYGVLSAGGQGACDYLQFKCVATALSAMPAHPVAHGAVMCILAALLFKIGIVPFHLWVPDVYQGAPTPTTALLAIASKITGLTLLIQWVHGPFAPLSSRLMPLLLALGATTVWVGNLTALSQNNTKRLFALSGVAHAGYLLLGVGISIQAPWVISALVWYALGYGLAALGLCYVLVYVYGEACEPLHVSLSYGLFRRNGLLAICLAVCLGSLAGLPPLMGFIGKFLLLIPFFQGGLATWWWVLLTVVAGVALSVYYYFVWMREAFFISPQQAATIGPQLRVGWLHRCVLVALVVGLVTLGFFQGSLGRFLF
jgi:NADH-quinone oxidoreductase subunit N